MAVRISLDSISLSDSTVFFEAWFQIINSLSIGRVSVDVASQLADHIEHGGKDAAYDDIPLDFWRTRAQPGCAMRSRLG